MHPRGHTLMYQALTYASKHVAELGAGSLLDGSLDLGPFPPLLNSKSVTSVQGTVWEVTSEPMTFRPVVSPTMSLLGATGLSAELRGWVGGSFIVLGT